MDNLNISFAPDKSAEEKGRINAVEDYLSLLTERIKFCLNGIDENIAQKSDGEEEKQLIYSTIADEVGQFTNTDKNCEVFNDYENNVASAYYSHAEGYMTTASAPHSHAEGSNTVASNPSCHAEGSGTTASGNCSHAENMGCIASGSNSHAEGYHTIARGEHSHASGSHTIAGMEVFALGRYNKKAEDVALVVGNGWGNDSHEYRSDALTLDYSGNLKLAGNLTANSPGWDYLGTEIHGAARFGNNWTSDSTSILLAVGNGADSKNLRDALTLDSDGNLHISGKFTADGGVGYVIPTATADTLGGVMIGDNINVSDSGTISVNLSAYLKNTDISNWAKAESKPAYTAEEVGAATLTQLDSKDYLKATEITGQTIDLNDITLNTASDKGKSRRYFCTSASAQNISNRPVSANEPFELTVDNIRYVNANAFNSVQRYTSATRKRSYTRWCDDNMWRAWMCDTDIVIYGTVTAELPKSFDYATYGEGYNQVEIEPYYDSNTNPIRNRIVLTLTSATAYDRDVLTVGDSVEHLKIENGTVMMSLTGTKTLSFMIKYTNKRA